MPTVYTADPMAHAKEKILDASLELFSAHGYASVTTRAIAEAAGVNEVTLFRLFGSKERLFREVFASFFSRPDEALSRIRPRYELEPDLVEYAGTFVDFFSANHKLVSMSIRNIKEDFADIDESLRDQERSMRAAILSYLGGMAASGAVAGSPEELSRLFVECLFGMAFKRIRTGGMESLGPSAAAFAAVFARGVAAGALAADGAPIAGSPGPSPGNA